MDLESLPVLVCNEDTQIERALPGGFCNWLRIACFAYFRAARSKRTAAEETIPFPQAMQSNGALMAE